MSADFRPAITLVILHCVELMVAIMIFYQKKLKGQFKKNLNLGPHPPLKINCQLDRNQPN